MGPAVSTTAADPDGFGFPATVFGGGFVMIPSSVFAIGPDGVFSPFGFFLGPPTFPFGVPFTVAGGTFVAIPSAAFATFPVI